MPEIRHRALPPGVWAARLGLAVTLAAVTWLSLRAPGLPTPGHTDKLAHLAAFLCLGWLADRAFPVPPYGTAKILPLLAYGLAIEWAQSFLPGRVASTADWLADAAGLALYPALIPLWYRLPFLQGRRPGESGPGATHPDP